MVQNPIYDGPVYESVQTHFDSLTTQVTAATPADNSCSKCTSLYVAVSASVDNATDKKRYISQPGIIDGGTLLSHEFKPVTNVHPERHNGESLARTSSVADNNDSVIQQSKF